MSKAKKFKNNNYSGEFYNREREINRMINDFKYSYKNLSFPPNEEEYDIMNQKRLEIKRLLDIQSRNLWTQSHRRKIFYHKQLDVFKYFYVAWKRYTYYIFLKKTTGMPLRFAKALSFYKKISKNIKYTITAL